MLVLNPQSMKDLRESLGISQAEAGRKAGFGSKCPGQTWYAYETGKVTCPKRDTIERIAKALNVGVVDLMIDDGIAAKVEARPVPMEEVEAAYAQGFADGQAGVIDREMP